MTQLERAQVDIAYGARTDKIPGYFFSISSDVDNDAVQASEPTTLVSEKRAKNNANDISPEFSVQENFDSQSKDELIDHVLELEKELDRTRTELETEKTKTRNLERAAKQRQSSSITLRTTASASPIVVQEWSSEKIEERAETIRSICAKEIKKQMKWQVSMLKCAIVAGRSSLPYPFVLF